MEIQNTLLKEKLQMEDPSERRMAAEELMSCELDEETVQLLSRLIEDPDKGVRDAVSMTLMYNGSTIIPKYVVPKISSADISVRNLSGEILLKIGENSIEEMVAFLNNANDDDIKFLIDIMGLIGSQKPVNEILQTLETNENENVILACFEAIGNIGYAEALPKLVEFYEKSELYKPTIIEALGKMNSKEVLDFILSKYSVEDELTKFSIIESLGNVGNESTFFFLLSELSNIKGPLVWTVISSLDILKEKYNLDLPFDESIKNSLLYTLLEADLKYKKAAANLASAFVDKDILNALLKNYGKDYETDESIKNAFYKNPSALYSKASPLIKEKPQNLRFILYLMKEMIEFENGESLNNMTALEKRNLCDSLSLCLDDPDEEVRKSVIELLFIINTEIALLFVDSMIEDDNFWNRLKVLELIENILEPKTNEILKKLVADPEEMVSDRAAWALSQRGITDSVIKTNQ